MTIKYIKRFHAGVSLVVFAVILYRFKIPRFFPFKYFSLKESIFLNSFSNLGAFGILNYALSLVYFHLQQRVMNHSEIFCCGTS